MDQVLRERELQKALGPMYRPPPAVAPAPTLGPINFNAPAATPEQQALAQQVREAGRVPGEGDPTLERGIVGGAIAGAGRGLQQRGADVVTGLGEMTLNTLAPVTPDSIENLYRDFYQTWRQGQQQLAATGNLQPSTSVVETPRLGGLLPTSPKWYLERGSETAAPLALDVLTGLLTGPLGFILPAVAQSAGGTYGSAMDEMSAAGVNPTTAHRAATAEALTSGLITFATNKIGLDKFFKGNPAATEALKRGLINRLSRGFLRGGAFEATQETSEQVLQTLAKAVRQYGTTGDVTAFEDFPQQLADGAILGFLAGGPTGAVEGFPGQRKAQISPEEAQAAREGMNAFRGERPGPTLEEFQASQAKEQSSTPAQGQSPPASGELSREAFIDQYMAENPDATSGVVQAAWNSHRIGKSTPPARQDSAEAPTPERTQATERGQADNLTRKLMDAGYTLEQIGRMGPEDVDRVMSGEVTSPPGGRSVAGVPPQAAGSRETRSTADQPSASGPREQAQAAETIAQPPASGTAPAPAAQEAPALQMGQPQPSQEQPLRRRGEEAASPQFTQEQADEEAQAQTTAVLSPPATEAAERKQPWNMTVRQLEQADVFMPVQMYDGFVTSTGLTMRVRQDGSKFIVQKIDKKGNVVSESRPESADTARHSAWRMSNGELANLRLAPESVVKAHRGVVEQAIREGKPVPPEVFKDYPDLAPATKPETPTPEVQRDEQGQAAQEPAPAAPTAQQPARKYAYTKVDLPPDAAQKVLKLGKGIQKKDLTDKGRETEPHITTLYGLPPDVTQQQVAEAVAQAGVAGPITVTLGETAHFAGVEGGSADAVYVQVESPELVSLNQKLSAALPAPGSTPGREYKPHVTLGYVKAGRGKAYSGNKALRGQTVTIDKLVLSTADDRRIEIPLAPAPGSPAPGSALQSQTMTPDTGGRTQPPSEGNTPEATGGKEADVKAYGAWFDAHPRPRQPQRSDIPKGTPNREQIYQERMREFQAATSEWERQHKAVQDATGVTAANERASADILQRQQAEREAAARKMQTEVDGLDWAMQHATLAQRKAMAPIRESIAKGFGVYTAKDAHREWYKGASQFVVNRMKREGWTVDHKSDSGSVYVVSPDLKVRLRISDHDLGVADYGSREQFHNGPELVLRLVTPESDILAELRDQLGEYEVELKNPEGAGAPTGRVINPPAGTGEQKPTAPPPAEQGSFDPAARPSSPGAITAPASQAAQDTTAQPAAPASQKDEARAATDRQLTELKQRLENIKSRRGRLSTADSTRLAVVNAELRNREIAARQPEKMNDDEWLANTRFYRSGKTRNAELPDGRRIILAADSTESNFRQTGRDFILSLKPASAPGAAGASAPATITGSNERQGSEMPAEAGASPAPERIAGPALGRFEQAVRDQTGDQAIQLTPAADDQLTAPLRDLVEIGRKLGLKVVFFRSGRGGALQLPGGIDPADPTTVYLHAEEPDAAVRALFAHEWSHSLKRTDPDLYNAFAGALHQFARQRLDAAGAAYLQAAPPRLRAALEADPRKLDEEAVAALVEDLAGRPEFWQSLAQNDRPLFDRIAQFVRELLERFVTSVPDVRRRLELREKLRFIQTALSQVAPESSAPTDAGSKTQQATDAGKPKRARRVTLPKQFTKAAIEKELLKLTADLPTSADLVQSRLASGESNIAADESPFQFGGDVPTEVRERYENQPDMLRRFKGNQGAAAKGDDLMTELGDGYFDYVESLADQSGEKRVEAAVEQARRMGEINPQAAFLAHLHGLLSSPGAVKSPQQVMTAQELNVGATFTIHGEPFEVVEDPDSGEKMLADGITLPADLVGDIPVDKDSLAPSEPDVVSEAPVPDDLASFAEQLVIDGRRELGMDAPASDDPPFAVRRPRKSGGSSVPIEPADTAGVIDPNDTKRLDAARRLWLEKGTASPYFRRWFGDSKVVDADGKPLVVYHGTDAEFTAFANRGGKQHMGSRMIDVPREGFFFAADPIWAKRFGVSKKVEHAAGTDAEPIVVAAYLSLKNPIDLRNPGPTEYQALVDAGFADAPRTSADQMWEAFDVPGVARALKKAGYDGAILSEDEGYQTSYVALRPEQIKSATGNRGTFDPRNPDIRFAARRDTEGLSRVAAKVAAAQVLAGNVGREDAVNSALRSLGVNFMQADPKLKAAIAGHVKTILATARPIDTATGKRLPPSVGQLERALADFDRREPRFGPQPAGEVKGQVKQAVSRRMQGQVVMKLRDAIRTSMTIRGSGMRAGRKEAIAEGKRLRQRVIEAAREQLPMAIRGRVLDLVSRLNDPKDLPAALERVADIFEEFDHGEAVRDLRTLISQINGDVTKMRPEFRDKLLPLIQKLDKTAMSDASRRRLDALAQYIEDNPEHDVPPEVVNKLRRLDKTPITAMPTEEIREIAGLIRQVAHQNNLKNMLIQKGKKRALETSANEIARDLRQLHPEKIKLRGAEGEKQVPGKAGFVGRSIDYTDGPEVLLVSALGQGSEGHQRFYLDFAEAESAAMGLKQRMLDRTKALFKKHGITDWNLVHWRTRTWAVKLGGEMVQLTGAQRLALVLNAANRGGRRKMLENGVILDQWRGDPDKTIKITAEELDAVAKSLRDWEQSLASEMLDQLNGDLKDAMNRTSVEVWGWERLYEPNYFPLQVDRAQVGAEAMDPQMLHVGDRKWMEQAGFLKERVNHPVPVVIGDALAIYQKHVGSSAVLAELLVPVRNARVLLGHRDLLSELDQRLGDHFRQFMTDQLVALSDLQVRPRSTAERWVSAMTRNAAVAILGLRPTTVLNNYLGAPVTLASQLPPSLWAKFVMNFAHVKANLTDAKWQRVAAHSPYLRERYDGDAHRLMTYAEGGALAMLADSKKAAAWRKFQQFSLMPMQAAERAAAVAAWDVLREHVAKTHASGGLATEADIDAETARQLELAVRRSQNPISPIDRSQFGRDTSHGPLLGVLFMFTSQLQKSRDIVRMAYLAQRQGKMSVAHAAAVGALAWTGTVAVGQLVRYLWKLWRRGLEDEDERYARTWPDAGIDLVIETSDMIHPVIGEVARTIREAAGGRQAFPTPGIRMISDTVRGSMEIARGVKGEDEFRMEPGGPRSRIEHIYRGIRKLAVATSYAIGAPVDAPLSIVEGGVKMAMDSKPEFELHNERSRLNQQLEGESIEPDDKRRLKRLDGVWKRIRAIRKDEFEGELDSDQADQKVREEVERFEEQERRIAR